MAKIGRNGPCPCGSGKKYKKCHCGMKDPVVQKEASPATCDSDNPESDLADMNPANADVMSPEYWEKMAERLPRRMRNDLGPMIEQVRQYAEMESHREEVLAAAEALEAHRAEYEKLTEDPDAFFQRAEKLFAEEQFADMRFHAADIQRAFKSSGCAPIAPTDTEFAAKTEKAIRFLLDDAQRARLSQRLLLTLPGYVAAGRYIDGWIIRHSADLTAEAHKGPVGPFLLAMFVHGLREWELQLEQEQISLFADLGISPEEIRKMGYDGVEVWMRDVQNQPEKMAAMKRFFAEHPDLRALTEDQCYASEKASVRLLQRVDARVLLLTPEEVEPWLEVLEQRLSELPKKLASRLESPSQPSRKDRKAFADVAYDVAAEMAKATFTPARLDQLKSQLHELRRGFPPEGDKDALLGIHGALIAVEPQTSPEDRPFLVSLCWMSLRASVDAIIQSSD